MTLLSTTYVVYLAMSAVITVVVARTLHHHGRPFLIDCFHQNVALADAINALLVVGFYLVNLAFVTLTLREGIAVHDVLAAAELLSTKIGFIVGTLGAWHFLNMAAFGAIRHHGWLPFRGK